VPLTLPARQEYAALLWWQGLHLYLRHPGSEVLQISLNGSRQQVQVVGDPAPQEEPPPLGPFRRSHIHEVSVALRHVRSFLGNLHDAPHNYQHAPGAAEV